MSTPAYGYDRVDKRSRCRPKLGATRMALGVLCLASFIAVVDTTIVSVALPSMQHDLGFSGGDAQWILNGYVLTFGGLLLVCGRAGDLYGRRRLFLCGLALFGAASLLGGFAPSAATLVGARALQGAGAAAFVPASLSLLTAIFAEGEDRNRAIGVYGAMAAMGFVVGMVGGGVLTELLGWRWVLFVNVPVALVALLVTPRVLSESRNEAAPRSLDLLGAVTATLGLAALIYAISNVAEQGWSSPTTVISAAAGTLLAFLFVVVERRSQAPLAPLSVFRRRAVLVPNAAIFLQSSVGVAWLFVLTLYFQEVLGHGPLDAGLLFLPMTLSSLAAAPVAGRLATRFGTTAMATCGLATVAMGVALMTSMSRGAGLPVVVLGMVVGEAGFMLSNVSLTIAGSGAVGEGEQGLSAGLLNTSIQLGSAWGLGVVATLVAAAGTQGSGPTDPQALIDGLRTGLAACAGFAIAALPILLVARPGKPQERASRASAPHPAVDVDDRPTRSDTP